MSFIKIQKMNTIILLRHSKRQSYQNKILNIYKPVKTALGMLTDMIGKHNGRNSISSFNI